jgi:hypothetical protein
MLTEQDIEAELSYAYLHAVASRAGFGCSWTHRTLDSGGVDAQVYETGRPAEPQAGRLLRYALDVQLKATRTPPAEQEAHYSFSVPAKQYNILRMREVRTPLVLVVLFLPENMEEWLSHSEEGLIARRCAYWVSLRGAEPLPEEQGSRTVYVPRAQVLSVAGLTRLMERVSFAEAIDYVAPGFSR